MIKLPSEMHLIQSVATSFETFVDVAERFQVRFWTPTGLWWKQRNLQERKQRCVHTIHYISRKMRMMSIRLSPHKLSSKVWNLWGICRSNWRLLIVPISTTRCKLGDEYVQEDLIVNCIADYWSDKPFAYPTLAKVAHLIYVTFVSSAASERDFYHVNGIFT